LIEIAPVHHGLLYTFEPSNTVILCLVLLVTLRNNAEFEIVFVVLSADNPVMSMFLAPAVTPWFSTMPGVGSNNPGIRLYKYSRRTRHIVDYTQYYLNLSAADTARLDNWTVEYRATEAYGISAVDAVSLSGVVRQFANDSQPSDLFGRYFLYNSVSYDLSNCTGQCKREQVCAASEVDIDKYSQCVNSPDWHRRHEYFDMSTTTKSHHHHGHSRRVFTYFLLGSLIFVIAVLFVVLALCCCQRRHAIVYFSRSHYSLIQDT